MLITGINKFFIKISMPTYIIQVKHVNLYLRLLLLIPKLMRIKYFVKKGLRTKALFEVKLT